MILVYWRRARWGRIMGRVTRLASWQVLEFRGGRAETHPVDVDVIEKRTQTVTLGLVTVEEGRSVD